MLSSKAENMLYNVHRSIICRHSAFFSDMFLIGQTGTSTPSLEGTEPNPLIVPAMTSEVLSDLLGVVYGWCVWIKVNCRLHQR